MSKISVSGCWAVFLLTGALTVAGADEVHFVDREGSVTVRAALNRTIEIVVEKGVADLVRSGDPQSLKVEHVAGRLFVTPLSAAPAELVIIDMAGRSYRMKFTTAYEGKADEKVVIAGAGAERSAASVDGEPLVGVLRALALGQTPAGSTRRSMDAVIFQDRTMRLRATDFYEMPGMGGYRMQVENMLPEALAVPVQSLKIPGLLAVSVEDDILSAAGKEGSSTYLVAVVSR